MNTHHVRIFLLATMAELALVVAMTASVQAAGSANKPNILFIFADDMCYELIGALNNDEVHTPNLDRLVKRGLTFTHAYNMGAYAGAVCISSRMMLNSGRFLWHAEALHDEAESERQAGRWWSEHMKKAGYDTYMTGKWHIKASAKKSFDHMVHERPGMPHDGKSAYNRPIQGRPDPWKPWDKSNGGYWAGGKHWSEVLAEDSTEFLEQAAQSDKPFFMYLAFNATHDPRQSPKEFCDMYPYDRVKVPDNFMTVNPFHRAMGLGPASPGALRDEALAPFPRTEYAVQIHRAEFYALLSHMDQQIGRILDALEETGMADNTWIFFTADHGLSVGQHGLMGKQNLFDESLRVPFIVIGPGVKPDSLNDTRIYLQDVMPTTLDLAGVPHPDHVEFKSLLPLIKSETSAHYDAIYGAYKDYQRAVVAGDFKLILYPKTKTILLFNLVDDPHEIHNLADDPSKKGRIHELFNILITQQRIMEDKLSLRDLFCD